MSLLASASTVLRLLRQQDVGGCLIGGLAVSVRCDPRFTRDVDLAIVVADDAGAEDVVRVLGHDGFTIASVVEQDAVHRMAMVRLVAADGVSIDLLMASSGIEPEIVADAETLEVVKGIQLPVARTGHLIALKLLSVAPGRETDAADLRVLSRLAEEGEWARADTAVRLIAERGFARGRSLLEDLEALRRASL